MGYSYDKFKSYTIQEDTAYKNSGKFSNSTQQTYCNDSGGYFIALNMVENIWTSSAIKTCTL